MSLAIECRRIFVSGAKCGALAVKGTNYCFFHQAARDFHRENVKRYKSIVVPPIEDRASIHVALQATLDAIGSNRMDPGRARVYLYALQLAMQNIGKDGVPFASDKSVTNPVCRDDEEYLAPDDVLDECEGASEPKTPEPSAIDIRSSGPEQISAAPTLPEGDGMLAQDFSPGNASMESLSPVGTTPSTASSRPALLASSEKSLGDQEGEVPDSVTKAFGPPSRENSRKPVVAESSQDDQSLNAESIDISASADDETASNYEEEPAHSLARYGLVRVWQYEDGELTEDELRKHQYVDGLINHTLRALYAAKPFRSPADRRQLREQTRSEFYNEYLVPRPELRNCTVTTRYCALLLS